MDSNAIKALGDAHILPTYARFDLCLTSGKGAIVCTPEGEEYLDFGSGIGVNSLGYCDEAWVAAVSAQAAKLQHTSNLYHTQPAAELAAALCLRTGMDKAFFCNSGAEANEGALKAARKYSRDKYGPGRHTVVALENSFHGRTMMTLAATGQAVFHRHFDPFPAGFVHVPPEDEAALHAALGPDVCAVLVEPIQGEGGICPLTPAYAAKLRALCAEKDILLIADEVQCGIGRTGHFLASEALGLQPDIVTLAKGLGGGLPLGAILFNTKTAGALGRGDHATTYGGNPVVCAGALAVMQRLDDAFLAEVTAKGKLLVELLRTMPGVAAVSGQGLMLGVELTPPHKAADVLQQAMRRHLLVLLAKDRLRLLPPLVVTTEQIRQGADILRSALEATQ